MADRETLTVPRLSLNRGELIVEFHKQKHAIDRVLDTAERRDRFAALLLDIENDLRAAHAAQGLATAVVVDVIREVNNRHARSSCATDATCLNEITADEQQHLAQLAFTWMREFQYKAEVLGSRAANSTSRAAGNIRSLARDFQRSRRCLRDAQAIAAQPSGPEIDVLRQECRTQLEAIEAQRGFCRALLGEVNLQERQLHLLRQKSAGHLDRATGHLLSQIRDFPSSAT